MIVGQIQPGFSPLGQKEASSEDLVPYLNDTASSLNPAILGTPSQDASVQISASYTMRRDLLSSMSGSFAI